MGLPPSKRAACIYDAVLVVVDRYTKVAIYIPTTKTVKAYKVAELLMQEVFLHYSTPEGIVSDRGSIFTSDF